MREQKFIITLLILTFQIYAITAQLPGPTTPGTGALPGAGGMPPMGGQGGGGERPKLPFGDKKLGNPSPTTPQSQHSDSQPQPNLPINHQQPNPQINQQQPNSPVNRQQPNSPKTSPVPTNAVTDQDAQIKTPVSTQQKPSPSTNAVNHSNSPQNDNGTHYNETSTSNGSFRNMDCNGLTMGIVTIMMSLWIYGMALKVE
ncbi:12882_t:CDS:1 [Dentiscutata erythropus]|uniref:12882_t:CDS:1 n=1 Tax=Dentiscutata erythropus TaxID=1348616 RepID=A0A9N9IZ97_9GLOM|nr:12882_t:CDS:1 [Dentiscutata erythropus]